MKIYTKRGDKGETSLIGGKRVPKSHLRIEAYGTVDEMNAFTGLLCDHVDDKEIHQLIREIQKLLFTIGSLLAAAPGSNARLPQLDQDDIKILESFMDKWDEELEPLTSFILPGGSKAISYAHLARCVCRRAERYAVKLSEESEVDPIIIEYLNRLSDFYFMLGRKLALIDGVEEVKWLPEK